MIFLTHASKHRANESINDHLQIISIDWSLYNGKVCLQ